MTVRFLVDAQLPPRFARNLCDVGHVAEHVNNIGLGAATDDEIAAHALASSSVIVTKDADFATLGRRQASLRVLWIRVGNVTAAALWHTVEPRLGEIVAAFGAGEVLIEIR
jgi:predicted nuclease of predicted toxin-antitoxin system